jgi:phosphatidylserine/phosphatidylglycerophosphate/cardiolipin synthase-like enzyme
MKSFIWAAAFVLALGSSAKAGQPEQGLFNNVEYAPIVDLINSAHSSVSMEIYEMDDPAVISALKDAIHRGVIISIVQEPKPVGATCRVFEDGSSDQNLTEPNADQPNHAAGSVPCDQLRQFVSDINAAGGKYVPFNKEALCPGGKNCFEHGKIAIIDSSMAMISSGNFNVSNLCDRDASPVSCDRDYSYVSRDESVVSALESVVKADLAGESYDLSRLLPQDVASKITVSPLTLQPLLDFITSAQDSIEIENQYLKEPNLNKALMDAARKGVKVSVMVSSACAFGKPRPSEVNTLTSIFEGFDGAGITTRIFTRNIQVGGYPGYLHAKAIVVDGTHAWMGSVNGSTEAVFHNREFGVFFDNPHDVSKLEGVMKSDFVDENAESWQDSLNCAENSSQSKGGPSPVPQRPRPHRTRH